jgi:hypothetical protein
MHRTTVHLPDDLKAALEQMSAATGKSEAELIREGVRQLAGANVKPRPTFPLFDSGDPISHRVDELLAEGFGLD